MDVPMSCAPLLSTQGALEASCIMLYNTIYCTNGFIPTYLPTYHVTTYVENPNTT